MADELETMPNRKDRRESVIARSLYNQSLYYIKQSLYEICA